MDVMEIGEMKKMIEHNIYLSFRQKDAKEETANNSWSK